MTEQMHFWDVFYGWCLGLSVFTVITMSIIIACVLYYNDNVTNMLAARQAHKHRMRELRLRGELIKAGADPAYVTFLEKQLGKAT